MDLFPFFPPFPPFSPVLGNGFICICYNVFSCFDLILDVRGQSGVPNQYIVISYQFFLVPYSVSSVHLVFRSMSPKKACLG